MSNCLIRPAESGDAATGRRIGVRAVGEAEFADGKPVALVGAFQDVTERRARGDELRLFEASIARINDAIVITKADVLDGSGPQIVFVNPAFEKMTGFCAEVIKYNDFVTLGSEAKVKEAGKMAVEGKEYVVTDGDLMHFRFNV